METKSKNIFQYISDIANSEDFDSIIEVAEMVLSFVPGGVWITKLIKVLKFVKESKAIIGTGAQAAGDLVNKLDRDKVQFNNLFNFALEDGQITVEEKNFLKPLALKAGYSEEEFELMVMNKKIL